MKLEDLGFNLKTGVHDKHLTTVESAFVGILWEDHVGPENAIAADELAVRFAVANGDIGLLEENIPVYLNQCKEHPYMIDGLKREIRYLHNHILVKHDHVPLLSKAGTGGGYWIAESKEEADEFYATFRARGMTGLVKASRGKKAAMVEMVEQLTFEFEDLVDKTDYTGPIKRRVGDPAPIEVVDAFLERMSKDPEKFADGLRKIGQKYGSILLPRARVAEIAAQAERLQLLVKNIF